MMERLFNDSFVKSLVGFKKDAIKAMEQAGDEVSLLLCGIWSQEDKRFILNTQVFKALKFPFESLN